ncbi:FAD-dependent monooxygenase [Actinomadura darangshiensis]|uniref:FAD-dependent monooxygenase n=1 Tax=Actinomadura darangshiensis TaxID=705336 RepID=A0A4R5ALK9_9ACTN|nr:NAD(P)/FAD-dependent oxidoreductase [Actinomadura darangshiensis]TDD72805.1 FAD-dependent monooxygenase [Actinomadura darangshiensis]
MADREHIIVAGAGPVGAVAALAAAQRGFRVTVVEANAGIETDNAPRAATFHPSTLELVDEIGIIDEFVSAGLVCRYFDFWDKTTGTLVARMDHDTLRDDTPFPFVVQTEQHKLVRIVLERLRRMPEVDIRLGWSVDSIEQDADRVTVRIGRDAETEVLTGAWLFGCDGGRSTVRKALDIEFEGYTWPERFAVLTTLHDFEAEMGCSYRAYFADPDQWVNLFKVAGDDMRGRWRVVFAARPDQTDEDALGDGHAAKVMSAVHPSAGTRSLVHRNIYNVHQRVAAAFRAGRVFLAGDAAHVNNPIGGLGLNCGVHDALELVHTVDEVAAGLSGAPLLDRYERRRRPINIEFVQQQTVDNKRRLEEKDPAKRRERLDDLARISNDKEAQRAFLRRTSLLDAVVRAQEID